MKVTKKLQAEITALMNDYWDSYFRGDIEHWRNYLVDDYRNIGGTEEEIWNSKKEILDYTFRVIDQMVGKTEIRNKETEIIPYDPYFMVHEFMDLFIKLEDEWTFYGKFRLSSLIQHTTNGWKVLHQHGSYPDAHTEKGEAFAFDKLKEENTQLREAVKRRTIELESKNRELEIEASLERVRTVAMTMKKPDDILDICKCIFTELQLLGFTDLRNSLINFFDDDSNALIDYDYSAFAGGQKAKLSYSNHPVFEQFQQKIRQSKDSFAELVVEKNLLESWIKRRRDSGEYEDPRLENINALYFYFYSIGVGAVGISTFSSVTTEKINILKRFRNVFDLAYRRYKDVENAEAQAKEAQIQLALERVRARTMAMQKSSELEDVALELRIQLAALGTNELETCAVNLYEESDEFVEAWTAVRPPESNEEIFELNFKLPKKGIYIMEDMLEAYASGVEEYVFVLEGEKGIQWMNTMEAEYPELFSAAAATPGYKSTGFVQAWFSCCYFTGGSLIMITMSPPLQESREILKQFTKVFGMAYRRFADLKKAEAQAREAQIETALEKVRSRSLAMHKSEELQDVVHTVFEKLDELNVELYTAIIFIFTEGSRDMVWWLENKANQQYAKILVPYNGNHYLKDIFEAKEKGKNFFSTTYSFEEKNELFNHLFENTDFKYAPEKQKQFLLESEWATMSVALAKNTGINITSYTKKCFSEKENEILVRFGNVFEQAYTRFLDLQKAEAQAREAQIEVAVERVRAKALAMHKSDEIMTVVLTMRNELESLNIPGVLSTSITLRQDDGSIRLWDNTSTKQLEDGLWESTDMVFRLEDNNPEFYFNRIWNTDEKYFVIEQDENDLPITVDWVRSFDSGMADTIEHYFKENDIKHCWHPGVQLSHGKLNLDSLIAPEPEMETILLKMGAAFDLAYKRFLDLQKAEAQAREAQIEVALERVRSRAMAMHKSEELADAAQLLYQEFLKLGIKTFSCGYMFIDEEKSSQTSWMVLPDGTLMSDPITFPLTGDQVLDSRYADWKLKKPLHVYTIQGEANVNHHRFLSKYVPSLVTEEIFSKVPDRLIFNCANFSEGYLIILAEKDFTEEEQQTIIRFANVFEMTYTRFLDLQKAEAQAREAQIQLALERIRARAMAMQKSDELLEVISVLAEQLQQLNIKYDNVSFAERNQAHDYKFWTSVHGLDQPMYLEVPYINNPMFESVRDIKVEELNLYSDILNPEESRHWHQHVFEHSQLKSLPAEIKEYVLSSGYARTIAFMPTIMFIIGNYLSKPYSIEENGIIKRFAGVFEQSYTRFLDLQKAEAQAREAQIEAALERVRSRSNAMQRSENLFEVISEVNDQLLQLGFRFDSADFMTDYSEKGYKIWLASAQETFSTPMYITSSDTKIPGLLKDVLERGDDFFTFTLNREEKNRYFKHVFNNPVAKNASEESKQYIFNSEGMAVSCVVVKNIILSITNFACIPYTESENDIIKRFGFAFEQSYTRFLDLQKAEAQAREAQIEAALERVRSRTIGMQKSEELREVIQIVFEQLRYLDFKIDSAHFNLNYKESDDYNLWTAAPGQPYPVKTYIPYFNHPVFATAREAKEKGLDFFTESYTREEKNEFFEHLFRYAPGIPEERRKYILSGQGVAASTVLLNHISLWIMNYSGVPYSAAENTILKRFGKIFEQSHTRFLDLQKAEAQAREAIKQASLDRIRAEIASMRTTGDLETITPLIWNELTVLGVPFIRCGVFIMNDLQRIAHTYLSTPDGKAIAAFDLAYDTPGNISQIVHQWQNKKLYIDYWDEAAYTAFAGNLVQKGIFTSPEQYFSTLPGGGFYLHFAPFLQGMLYVGNTTQLSDEEINLIQCVANAFATAYARYEDFNKLEAAKKQVDNTLHELQLTQKQLIQSEKMASLGELTAGIAHEIQNPLNFVNNFSEINKELLHEMNEEIEKGNLKEVKLLAKNIIENEQKISHHGTRADAIVKGMLQHSRTSSGQKEPTDINELADEYLRLAYHGLRAKDKSFNATLNTSFDETISNINIVPQDIGRVILNLINNGFYAVNEKKKQCQSEHIEDYEPTVTISTKKINDKVEIKIADNGNGIPQNIVDKIFQPFFSTKPAGQGTGLGLSLSYDIVKAHGGEIKVNTKEGEGSVFIIQLPEA